MSDVYVLLKAGAAGAVPVEPPVYGTIKALARALMNEDPVLQSVAETLGRPVADLFNFNTYAKDLATRLPESGSSIEVGGGIVYRSAVLTTGQDGEIKEKEKPGRKPGKPAKPGKGKGRPEIEDEQVEDAIAL